MGKGSGRSVTGFDLYLGLTRCQEYLLEFGGHELACGLSLKESDLEGFRQALEKAVLETAKEEVAQLSKRTADLVRSDIYTLTQLYETVHTHSKKIMQELTDVLGKIGGAHASYEEDLRLADTDSAADFPKFLRNRMTLTRGSFAWSSWRIEKELSVLPSSTKIISYDVPRL
jgi:hypothetical protein